MVEQQHTEIDPILAEIRRTREHYAEQFHGDARKMMEDFRRRHAELDRTSVTVEGNRFDTAAAVIPPV